MSLKNAIRLFSIQARMRAMVGVTLAMLLLVGLIGLMGLERTITHANEHAEHAFAELNELGQLREGAALLQLESMRLSAQAQQGWGPQTQAIAERWRAEVARMTATAQSMLEGEEDEDNAHARLLLTDLAAHQRAMDILLDRVQSGALSSPTEMAEGITQALALTAPMQGRLDAITQVMVDEAEEGQHTLTDNARLMELLYAGATLVSMVLVSAFTVANQRSICEPIEAARNVALSIAGGQLDNRIDAGGRDECSNLLMALDRMQSGLKSIVQDVRDAASAISLASHEIASGNMDLSGRTENAASSLQQTASSMEQLTQTVKQNADAAQAANGMAQQAEQAANGGQGIMNGVVSSMEDIQRTSQRIHDIIGVIDGIAFQTNILALNAAVEAARAGEQGRGFAVVASEVRGLAQRSASAAREIKQLIEDSGEKVSSGSRLVTDAGQAMNSIIEHVRHVRETIGAISINASEQSTGIGQIGQAVNQLDQMTQQNAALVEQSAAASSSLKDQAERLSQTVQTFRL